MTRTLPDLLKCATSNLRSLVYLSLSNSVGGAILTGGALYGGDHLRAGEFGHNTLVPDGRPCYCGKRAVWMPMLCKVLSQLTDGNLALFFDGLRSGNASFANGME